MEFEGGRPFLTLNGLHILPKFSLTFIYILILRLRLRQKVHKHPFNLNFIFFVNTFCGIVVLFFY